MYNIDYMYCIIIKNNIYFPSHTFWIPVEGHNIPQIQGDKELAVFFNKPVNPGDIGLRCEITRISQEKIVLKGICRINSLQNLSEDAEWIDVVNTDDTYEKNIINEGLIQAAKALVRIAFPGSSAIAKTTEPGLFADMVASNLDLSYSEKNRFFHTTDSIGRIKLLFGHINRVSPKPSEPRQNTQHATNPHNEDIKNLEQKIGNTPLSKEASILIKKEIARLKFMHPFSPEYSVSRTYIEFVLSMPWGRSTQDHLDIDEAKRVLDHDHFDLKEVKERILEFLAVKKLNPESRGSILCFVGPPGVGKTSLGKSIASAMGRTYIRMSLGGIRDEAEIRGHRRTYIGSMPGRIIKEIQRSGTINPVFILDEIDKMGQDFRGDPSSALLEVLDPEQNYSFRDNYLEIPFDLSGIVFVATANSMEHIPSTLLDRMETIDIPGYTDEEKFQIARRYLLPKVAVSVGLGSFQEIFDDDAIALLISGYTMEAGVRGLEKKIESIYRKGARIVASGDNLPEKIDPSMIMTYLGPPSRYREQAMEHDCAGMITGLAWTSAGGEILIIETTSMPGTGKLELTGNMGEIMQESAKIALGYLKSHTEETGIARVTFSAADIHIHVPAGAISKDGPSAGLAMLCALASHFLNRPVRHDTAVTGEITLTGRVLPVGGIKEKLLAARRSGISRVILPEKNRPDVVKLYADTNIDLEIIYVDSFMDIMDEVFSETYLPAPQIPAV
ncbi:MAG: endopeptidase La [Thermodesulfobacteriota bacterium]|nr:endopeptidase La [Thermodesulfobacteriota bacterium]